MQMAAALVQEYSHAEDESIPDRCENWGRVYVDRMRRSRILSLEGRYRNPQARHWDYEAVVGTAPDVRPYLDTRDADVINSAWQTIPDAYHQTLLGGHYVRRWSPIKCSRVASKTAGLSERTGISAREFDMELDMAHRLLEKQLALPAVFRREWLVMRVRTALELDVWGKT